MWFFFFFNNPSTYVKVHIPMYKSWSIEVFSHLKLDMYQFLLFYFLCVVLYGTLLDLKILRFRNRITYQSKIELCEKSIVISIERINSSWGRFKKELKRCLLWRSNCLVIEFCEHSICYTQKILPWLSIGMATGRAQVGYTYFTTLSY